MPLSSRTYEASDPWEFIEMAYEKNWTDGMPVCPPTPERVEAMIACAGRKPEEVVGVVPPQNGEATIEKLAIQCVMGGCRPEYFPVVLAALDAMLEEKFNLYGVETTLHPCEPLVVVSGPIVKALGFNTGDAVFGAGRPNATIGRAIRLILWNIGGSYPGVNATAPLGHPGRYGFCIAENLDENPWPPLHRDFGLTSESGVVVIGVDGPQAVLALPDARHTLNIWADGISRMSGNNIQYMAGGQGMMVMAPPVAKKLTAEGWSKRDIQTYLFDTARRRLGDLKRGFYTFDPAKGGNAGWPKWVDQTSDETLVPIVSDPSDIFLAVAGGVRAHWFSAWCPGWGLMGGLAVARPVELPKGRGAA